MNSTQHDQLNSIDTHTVSFFKLALFKNTSANYPEVHEFFYQYVCNLIKNESRTSFFRFYLILSFFAFKKQFIDLIANDLKAIRNRWLISNCETIELYGLDAKESQLYFQNFEIRKTLEYISNFGSVENWIQNEYNKVRFQLFFSLIKKKSHLILFWFAILFFLVFFFIFAAKDNSFTLAQQIRVWINFIMGKSS